mmetsp:Transcript_20984/g.40109  ORF Transcript_20984/g.40109 Transcript_20984/m.40109 type:complete len:138 (+) Transcript_20984:74-487(+)
MAQDDQQSAAPSETMYMGISMRNWGILLSCLLTLYVSLGCYFGALMSIAVECRGAEYMKLPTTFFGSFDRDNYYEGYGAAVDDEVPLYPWLFNTACPNNKHADGPMTDVFIPNCDNPVYSKCEITDAMSANVRCQLP